MTGLSPLLSRADRGAGYLVIAAAAIMVTVVSAQVVMRYIFNSSFDWADEVSRLAFVATIFLAVPLGIRDGTHVGIDLIVARLPLPVRRFVRSVVALIGAALMLTLTWAACIVALTTWSERLGALDITSSVFFFPVIVGAAHSALHLLDLAVFPQGDRA